MSRRPIRLHAIYVALDDAALFRASVASIYAEVDGITVITNHDRDWHGGTRDPSGITAMILSREVDPDRKIDLIVTDETNEARARGRAMDFAAPRRRTFRVQQEHPGDPAFVPPDYFLIVDSDEIYEAGMITRLKAHVGRHRHPIYRVPCVRYFKRWNYRVDGYEWAVSVVRADQRLPYLRKRRTVHKLRRGLARMPGVRGEVRGRLLGSWDVPVEVACFHHGSYVGPRARIAAKLSAFGHSAEVGAGWLTEVYDRWSLESRNFNPAYPEMFPSAREIASADLPAEIRDLAWPDDYLIGDAPTGDLRVPDPVGSGAMSDGRSRGRDGTQGGFDD